MTTTDKQPTPERDQTDASLRAERKKADEEALETRACAEEHADDVVERARQQADQTLDEAREKADATLVDAGASVETRAIAMAGQPAEDTALDAERNAADRQLAHERRRHHRDLVTLLRVERGQTDKDLALERSCSDEGLVQILAQLDEAVTLREKFLSMASHQLNTPLTPLSLRLQSLAQEAARQPDSAFARHVNDYVSAAKRQVRRLSSLVNDLLDVAWMSSGALLLEPVDVGTVVRDVVAQLGPEIATAGSVLEVEAPTVTGIWDELKLRQAITCLVENGTKFGGGKPIRIRLQSTAEHVRLSVQDQGIGIEPEHLSRIFEPFERAVSDRNYGGFGLGLSACRTLVEAMDGTLSVRSEPGRGSTFTIELPLSATKHAAGAPGVQGSSP